MMRGFKRARWRGIEKQSIQDLLIATIQNMKILARKDLWSFFASERPPFAGNKAIRRSIALSKDSVGKIGGEKEALQSNPNH